MSWEDISGFLGNKMSKRECRESRPEQSGESGLGLDPNGFDTRLVSKGIGMIYCVEESRSSTIQAVPNLPGADRVSSPESSLINCSWYASNACCKRTEVTSVFGEMYPLYGASKECSDRINYLMCYFCSPEQYIWYNRKAFICEDYCNTVYEHCWAAEYNGTAIGQRYESGTEFCLGQRFEVVGGTTNCFKFDPTVFSQSYHQKPSLLLTLLASFLIGLLVLVQ
ncbi:hypothetical protein LSH36_244g04005 [Paralvinella palmiformis]|uniref:Folate receptor-like domain-containing protein n=1 Tax=Paralvinella palmiformis TaxID=53620 RepID=A0AAD9JMN6_9ANNE|nr:hypothetical protein LSH36_244g04005 [Paralvinella palmiformis]